MVAIEWMLALSLLTAEPTSAVSDASRPYRILCEIGWDSSSSAEWIRRDFEESLRRACLLTFGEAWELHFASPTSSVSPEEANKFDKRFSLSFSRSVASGGWDVRAREYDGLLAEWGPEVRREAARDADRVSLAVSALRGIFRPWGRIVGKDRGKAELVIVGSFLVPSASRESFVPAGTPFVVARKIEGDDAPPTIVQWSYLVLRPNEVGSADRLTRSADVVSVFRDPLTRRSRKRIELWSIACPPESDGRTLVRFLTRGDNRPIVGYEVVVRPQGQTAQFSVGTTDYRGQAVIDRNAFGVSTGGKNPLVDVLLKSGNTVVARFPLVPGTPAVIEAKATVDPLLAEVAGATLAMQEEVVDLAAHRKILEIRLNKAAADANLELTKSIAEEINNLPKRNVFSERLAGVRASIERRSQELKQKGLGADVRRLFIQTERILDAVPQEKLVIEQQEVPTGAREPASSPAAP